MSALLLEALTYFAIVLAGVSCAVGIALGIVLIDDWISDVAQRRADRMTERGP